MTSIRGQLRSGSDARGTRTTVFHVKPPATGRLLDALVPTSLQATEPHGPPHPARRRRGLPGGPPPQSPFTRRPRAQSSDATGDRAGLISTAEASTAAHPRRPLSTDVVHISTSTFAGDHVKTLVGQLNHLSLYTLGAHDRASSLEALFLRTQECTAELTFRRPQSAPPTQTNHRRPPRRSRALSDTLTDRPAAHPRDGTLTRAPLWPPIPCTSPTARRSDVGGGGTQPRHPACSTAAFSGLPRARLRGRDGPCPARPQPPVRTFPTNRAAPEAHLNARCTAGQPSQPRSRSRAKPSSP